MKKNILTISMIFAFAISAQATDTSKIICTFGADSGALQTILFQGPPGVDLSNPGFQESIELSGKEFSVHSRSTRMGHTVTYGYRTPFFVNDYVLKYEFNSLTGGESLKGTLTVDHPPVYQLNCQFGE